MVIGKARPFADRDARLGERSEEFLRIANAGKSEYVASAQGGDRGVVGFEPAVEDRDVVAASALHDGVEAVGPAHDDERVRFRNLRFQRRPQRAGRYRSAIADAAAAVDSKMARSLVSAGF